MRSKRFLRVQKLLVSFRESRKTFFSIVNCNVKREGGEIYSSSPANRDE